MRHSEKIADGASPTTALVEPATWTENRTLQVRQCSIEGESALISVNRRLNKSWQFNSTNTDRWASLRHNAIADGASPTTTLVEPAALTANRTFGKGIRKPSATHLIEN